MELFWSQIGKLHTHMVHVVNLIQEAPLCFQYQSGVKLRIWFFVVVQNHVLTTVVLYPQDEISAGVADRFHGDTRVLFDWRLGEQLPCRSTWGHEKVWEKELPVHFICLFLCWWEQVWNPEGNQHTRWLHLGSASFEVCISRLTKGPSKGHTHICLPSNQQNGVEPLPYFLNWDPARSSCKLHTGRLQAWESNLRPVFQLFTEKAKPETLSSSLMKATFPLAVILSRPDQSGASSFQSAALLYFKAGKRNLLWNHKKQYAHKLLY